MMRTEVLAALTTLRDDMKECAGFYFEEGSREKGAYDILAVRVDAIIDLVSQYFNCTDEVALNATRWKLAFQTPRISIEFGQPRNPGNVVSIYRDTYKDGQVTDRKLLAIGRDLPSAVDVFLGFTR